MRYLIVESGVVTNVALAADPMGPNWIQREDGGVGWTYDAVTQSLTPPPSPAPANATPVSKRQACLALDDEGISEADVEAAIQLLDGEDAKRRGLIEWRTAGVIERTSPLVAALAPLLGLDDQRLDVVFARARGYT